MPLYRVLTGQWGHDPRFAKDFEFTEDEVPENYEFERGLEKGSIVELIDPEEDVELVAEISTDASAGATDTINDKEMTAEEKRAAKKAKREADKAAK